MTYNERFPLSVKGAQDRIQAAVEACATFQAVMSMDCETPTFVAVCGTCGLNHRVATCPHNNIDEYQGKCDDCGADVPFDPYTCDFNNKASAHHY